MNLENKLFQEMKETMSLNDLPSRKFNGIFAHLLVTCLVFNYIRLYMFKNQPRIKEIGIKMFIRNHLSKSENEIVVYCGNRFGVMSLTEYTDLIRSFEHARRE